MAETARYEKFRELLRNGIGTRNNTEFSEATGIARETISRFLNKETIPQPARETLVRISKNIKNCTLNDLLESCGYPRITLEEHVASMENDLIQGIENHIHETWTSVERFIATIEYFWLNDATVIADDASKEVEVIDEDNPADYCRQIRMNWEFEGCNGECRVMLYFVKNKKGHTVFTSYKFADEEATTEWEIPQNERSIYLKERHVMHTNVFVKDKVKENAEKKLLALIFGEGLETYVSETVLGVGFNYDPKNDEDLAVFKEFLYAHAASYCTSAEKSKIFQFVSEFEGSFEEFDEHLLDDEKTTLHDIVAEIMANETSLKYEAWPNDEENSDGCLIMYRCENKSEQSHPAKETLMSLSAYARELKVSEFGACYKEVKETKTAQTYKTTDFYATFE